MRAVRKTLTAAASPRSVACTGPSLPCWRAFPTFQHLLHQIARGKARSPAGFRRIREWARSLEVLLLELETREPPPFSFLLFLFPPSPPASPLVQDAMNPIGTWQDHKRRFRLPDCWLILADQDLRENAYRDPAGLNLAIGFTALLSNPRWPGSQGKFLQQGPGRTKSQDLLTRTARFGPKPPCPNGTPCLSPVRARLGLSSFGTPPWDEVSALVIL